eukprot:11222398-Lingulodinium_polyedra.AAC.1
MLREESGPKSGRRAAATRPKVSCWSRAGRQGQELRMAFLNETAERKQAVVLAGPQMGFCLHVDDGI